MDKTVLFITGRGALNLDEGKTSKARVQCSGVGQGHVADSFNHGATKEFARHL